MLNFKNQIEDMDRILLTVRNLNQTKMRDATFTTFFTINHRWLVVIGLNLKLTLRLLFCPNNNN